MAHGRLAIDALDLDQAIQQHKKFAQRQNLETLMYEPGA